MSAGEWQEIYAAYGLGELDDEIARLKQELADAGNIIAQGSGSKNYQRDTSMLRARLLAATREKAKRTGGGGIRRVGYVDAGD